VWSIFASLRRTLAHGHATPATQAAETEFSFESEWAGFLAHLKLPPHTLHDVVVAGSLDPHFRYRRFWKSKRNGGQREIAEPDSRLKRLQHRIIARYLGTEQAHPAAVAYQRGKSTADHVWEHAGAEVVVTADIQDFFPNTRADRVEAWWRERVDNDTAQLLTLLTTDRGGLPQGAPTSPALSNFVNRELDTRLAQRAIAAGATYTRYCDDLAFSWPMGFGPPAGFEASLRTTLHEFGYTLHPTKGWHIYDRRDEPEITGVILTRSGGVRLPDRLRQVMRKLASSPDPHDAQRLDGYLGYAAMMTRGAKRWRKLKKGARTKPAPETPWGGSSGENLPMPHASTPAAVGEAEDDIPF